MDVEVVAALLSAASGPSSFAETLRLMAGHELASEGFLPGQVGSSAMPHKMNARTCERINGFHVILRGHLDHGRLAGGSSSGTRATSPARSVRRVRPAGRLPRAAMACSRRC
jgi:adenylosuccinate lyase